MIDFFLNYSIYRNERLPELHVDINKIFKVFFLLGICWFFLFFEKSSWGQVTQNRRKKWMVYKEINKLPRLTRRRMDISDDLDLKISPFLCPPPLIRDLNTPLSSLFSRAAAALANTFAKYFLNCNIRSELNFDNQIILKLSFSVYPFWHLRHLRNSPYSEQDLWSVCRFWTLERWHLGYLSIFW